MIVVSEKQIAKANAITHAGVFHADDVLATAILDAALGRLSVCRVSRVPLGISKNAIVYDIGGGKYDHHQVERKIRENGVPYASAGLIWRDFGKLVVARMGDSRATVDRVDQCFIQGVDQYDNGGLSERTGDVSQMTFPKIIALWNPPGGSASRRYDEAFTEAVSFAHQILERVIADVEYELEVRAQVEQAISLSANRIMMLDRFMPWQHILFESDSPKAAKIRYVVFPSVREGFNCQCVPDAPGGHGQRKPFPRAWRGLQDEELQAASGVPDAIFCHAAGFIAAAKTRKGATQLAIQSNRLHEVLRC